MPDASNLFGTSSSPGRSTSPYASQDTSLNAHTSLSPDRPSSSSTNGSPVYLYPSAAPAMTTPTGLRKSISVDSFVKYKSTPTPPSRPPPPSPLSSDFRTSQADHNAHVPVSARAVDMHTSSLRPALTERDRRPQFPLSSRNPGTSTTATADDRDAAFLDESDVERSEEFSRRARKGKGTSRHSIRPGDLPLPSRLQPKGSVPSMHMGPYAAPIVPPRSSSLNYRDAKHNGLMPLHTQFAMNQTLPEMSLLVIGPHGCGKSSFIQKGLKHYGLSKPEEITIESFDGESRFTYTQRWATLPAGQGVPEIALRVLEADVSTFNLSDARGVWSDATDVWNGILICYDVTDPDSFRHMEDLLKAFGELRVPRIAIACKTDLQQRVNPRDAATMLKRYDVGLIEVSTNVEPAKAKIRLAFECIIRCIVKPPNQTDDSHQNPASPTLFTPPSPSSWEISRASSATPTASSSHYSAQQVSAVDRTSNHTPSQSISPGSQPMRGYHLPMRVASPAPNSPASPTRVRSTGDLLSEHEKSKREERDAVYNGARNSSPSSFHAPQSSSLGTDGPSSMTDISTSDGTKDISVKESRSPPWMCLDDLLNKLLFMAVCDDDPVFISHFLLTYRRFASPRTVLLAMQKRMRSLDGPTGDPMFACYAQMRICQLLDLWISTYPTDFAVPGASSALAALIKSIITKTYLLHYGAEFLPFLEVVASLKDKDASWALKVEEDSSDASSFSDEERSLLMDHPASPRPASPALVQQQSSSSSASGGQQGLPRERKASLPLTARALISAPTTNPATQSLPQEYQANGPPSNVSPKHILRHLQNVSQALASVDPSDIAQEMTRIQCQFFLRIEPRHWLQHVFVQGKKDMETDPITMYNLVSNHFGEWVVSLILSHDKPKGRARQIEKFIDVANRLRTHHNYSGLRAIIAGINSATFEGDESLELLRTKSAESWKNFQQWDQLLQSVRSHQKYRMALRNTKGACIPALEIHLSDLIRAHEGNPDYHDGDPNKIHWAKFNMMARFIDTIVECQKGCRESSGFERFPDREELRKLFMFEQEHLLMDDDMQRSRMALPDLDGFEDNVRSGGPRMAPRDPSHHKDAAIFRKLLNFSWA
ncbi:ras GEF [Trametes punicea]|nr:ras GEF [Trametes punicea]